MKRLTGRRDGRAYIIGCPDFALPKIAGLIIQQVVDRLAAIEDILGDEYELDRLRELVETDKDGRYVVLPCKIGATVYVITIQSDDFCGDRQVIVQAPFRLSLLDDIGKRVFLTHEEAESALKARDQE